MAMAPFYTRFRDLAFQEMRVATIQGRSDIPDGEYGFLELYCEELGCDCRRVIINVISKTTGPKVWATINYGWETPEYYASWSRVKESAEDMSGAELDPLNPQTQYSWAFLDLFEYILQDQAYVDRLKRHYDMFKKALSYKEEARSIRRKKKQKTNARTNRQRGRG